ncbi:hypothetical protein HWI79_2051 [Cryptosporidium felis]|nr:hypothetical protein HWI79_2051 [Cryptosporidium felis]
MKLIQSLFFCVWVFIFYCGNFVISLKHAESVQSGLQTTDSSSTGGSCGNHECSLGEPMDVDGNGDPSQKDNEEEPMDVDGNGDPSQKDNEKEPMEVDSTGSGPHGGGSDGKKSKFKTEHLQGTSGGSRETGGSEKGDCVDGSKSGEHGSRGKGGKEGSTGLAKCSGNGSQDRVEPMDID